MYLFEKRYLKTFKREVFAPFCKKAPQKLLNCCWERFGREGFLLLSIKSFYPKGARSCAFFSFKAIIRITAPKNEADIGRTIAGVRRAQLGSFSSLCSCATQLFRFCKSVRLRQAINAMRRHRIAAYAVPFMAPTVTCGRISSAK